MKQEFKAREKLTVITKKDNIAGWRSKAWSHQDDLKALVGRKVVLGIGETRTITGILLAADQFTVKVSVTPPGRSSFTVVYFKSTLTYFMSGSAAEETVVQG